MSIVWHEELSAPAAITGPVQRKDFIAIHWYGDPATAGDVHATARYLASVTHASVNYVAGSGHAYCLINPTRVAYGQGDGANGYGNNHGISIECDPRMSASSFETVAQVIAKVRRDFGVNFPLRPHNDFTSTQCPGVWEARLGELSNRANAINAGVVNVAPASSPAPAPVSGVFVPNDHWKVDPGDTMTQIAKHYRVSVFDLAKFNGIKDPSKITVGERIWSPKAGRDTWHVGAGDTLAGISQWYKANHNMDVSVDQLKYANGINKPETETTVGLRLLVP